MAFTDEALIKIYDMNFETLQSSLIKSKIKIAIIGVLTLFLGVMGLIGALSEDSKIVYWVFAGIFLLLGLVLLGSSLMGIVKIKSGEFPLLKAIQENKSDYLVWIYQKQINSKVSGVTVAKTANIVLYTKAGKMMEIALGKKGAPDDLIDYLATVFPNAHIGFDPDTRETVSALLDKQL